MPKKGCVKIRKSMIENRKQYKNDGFEKWKKAFGMKMTQGLSKLGMI